jgi:hypothetical protein
VVVRGKADFWRATLVTRARKAQGGARRARSPASAYHSKSVKERQGSASADGSEDEVLVKSAAPTGSSKGRGGAERGLMIATSDSAKELPPVSRTNWREGDALMLRTGVEAVRLCWCMFLASVSESD